MASIGTDTFFAPLSELNASLKAGEFSAEDLARAFSERLQQLGPRYNALALPLHQEALRQAKEVDKDLKRQRLRGPLQGIPYGVKDLLAYAGQPTTWGAKPYAGQVFDYTATVIQKLSAVGAVLAGKLSMVELAGGGGYRFPSASLTGPGLNPWDRSRWSGGSSSGSASAVAAGLVPFAIGSETPGSLVTPAPLSGGAALRRSGTARAGRAVPPADRPPPWPPDWCPSPSARRPPVPSSPRPPSAASLPCAPPTDW